uniref:Uncharacterized protein n=1 Tax=Dulem virus 42 TaxID=3145760 RepID=A0AAU8B7T4_9CAUD
MPDGTVSKTIRKALATINSVGDFISRTFFYRPDATETIHLRVNGKDLQFNKPIAPGSQLAKKLTQKGWLTSAKKYYVVSQAIENIDSFGDPRDAMTVSLILEDDTNTYIVTLRQLGATISKI